MDSYAPYDTLRGYKVHHKLVLKLADELSDEQLLWTPDGYNNSIAFNLWHIARWADNLVFEVLKEFPELGLDMGDPREIWEQESLGQKWGLPPVLNPGGTGLSDEEVEGLVFPSKDELLSYVRKTFTRTQEFIEKLDTKFPTHESISDEKLHRQLTDVRWHLYYYLLHDSRHLGMMEALKGLMTGKGSASA
jgi:hypothetical protein